MAANLCLQVLKFSYATGVSSDNTIPWKHILAPNMSIIVKGSDTGVAEEDLSMRIVQANEVLVSTTAIPRYCEQEVADVT